MITPQYAQAMASYNRWQNANLFAAADGVGDQARQLERGAFFGSVEKTLNHLLWADILWMQRFTGGPAPRAGSIAESVAECADWGELKTRRSEEDARIVAWADRLDAQSIAGDLTWFSGAANRNVTKPLALLVVHFFNHQTHHRGQVHAMLTAAGARPGDTDLPFMP